MKNIDVTALGELLIDFTENGISENGNPLLEANPGGAPCNVLAMLQKLGKKTAFIGKVGNDNFGHMLSDTIIHCGIWQMGLFLTILSELLLLLCIKRQMVTEISAFTESPVRI